LLKLVLPDEILLLFQGNVSLSIAALMLLAMLVSVCSEADAFVAAGFAIFPAAAQLSFVSIGPMVDIKLVFMYLAVFNKRVVIALILGPILLVFIFSNLIGILI
jgi:uncharacterized membrane protein YraQ (UPF0718 family)